MDEWISVKDRLPERFTPVLVCYIGKDNNLHSDGVAVLKQEDSWYWWEGSLDDSWNEIRVKITHWMPLPEAPKEGEHEV